MIHPHTLAHQRNKHKPQAHDKVQIFTQHHSPAYGICLWLNHSLPGVLLGFVLLIFVLLLPGNFYWMVKHVKIQPCFLPRGLGCRQSLYEYWILKNDLIEKQRWGVDSDSRFVCFCSFCSIVLDKKQHANFQFWNFSKCGYFHTIMFFDIEDTYPTVGLRLGLAHFNLKKRR